MHLCKACSLRSTRTGFRFQQAPTIAAHAFAQAAPVSLARFRLRHLFISVLPAYPVATFAGAAGRELCRHIDRRGIDVGLEPFLQDGSAGET